MQGLSQRPVWRGELGDDAPAPADDFGEVVDTMLPIGQNNYTDVVGATVYSDAGEGVGDIVDLVVDFRGDLEGVVLSVGGFLGIGTREVIFPAEDFTTGEESYSFELRTATEQLEAAPEFGVATIDDVRIVEFLFATNRVREIVDSVSFGFGRSQELTFGAARVRIPEDHKIGRIELPRERRFLFISFGREQEDPKRHFLLRGMAVLERDQWVELAKLTSVDRSALIFVHGYNNTFERSVYRTAQIIWDLQYKGTAVLFSWPSRGDEWAYIYDQNSALVSRDSFIEVLRILRDDAELDKIHVLAHSMGSYLVLDALAQSAGTADPITIGELIMAAPDIDEDHYRRAMRNVGDVVQGATLYASSNDKAMVMARRLASGARRAGDVIGGQPLLIDGVDAIDVSVIGAELLGLNHNMFAETRSLINDIKGLISRGIRPPDERTAEIRVVPEGAAAPLFWRYAP